MKIRKIILSLCGLSAFAAPVTAGGLLTNTNQNIAFLRNPARDAAIGIDGVYSNPAGLTFLKPGWHISLNIQSAYQTRTAESFFQAGNVAPLAVGEGNAADGWKKYEGRAKAPVIPSIQLAWVGKRWALSGGFAITGGGGKCTFDDGLGSFESQVAMLPVLLNGLVQQQPGMSGVNLIDGYRADMYMKGRQYYYGMQLGVGYRITPQLSAHVGGRLVLADCNYYGYVRNIQLHTAPAAAALGLPQGYVPAGQLMEGMGYPHFASLVADRALDCNQSGWTFMPVVSVNYKLPRWNFAARYEFKGRMHLKNQSNNTSGVAEFDDGQKVWAEIPALLTLGVSYDVLPNLRASVGYHYFFDRQAAQYEHREKKLKSGTQEFLAGLEYDINKRITVSAGYQSTNYGLGSNSEFLSDMSFVTSSNSVGLGAAFQLTPTISMNVAYFKTFYKTYTKHHDDFNHIKSTLSGSMQALVGSGQLTANELQAAATLGAMLPQLNTEGTDRFHRTNDVFGVNLNFDF